MCERDQSSISHQWESGTAPLQGRESQERTGRWKINLLWPGKFTIGRFQISFTSLNVCHLGELVVVIIIIRRWTLDNGQALKKMGNQRQNVEIMEIRCKMWKSWKWRKIKVLTDWGRSSSNELSGDGKEALRNIFNVLLSVMNNVIYFCVVVFSYFATRYKCLNYSQRSSNGKFHIANFWDAAVHINCAYLRL